MKKISLAAVAVATSLFATTAAHAQDTSTVGGSVGGTGTVTTQTTTTTDNNANANGNTTATLPRPAVAATATPTADGPADHEQVVGRFAVGYFGASQIPISSGTTGGAGSITAPFVGVRYWLSERLGLDLALGFRTQSGSTETVSGNVTTTTDQPGVLAVGVKAGIPLALAYGKHFTFTLVPEILLAGATRTVVTQGAPDTSLTGSRIELGARAGAEIHFGFIGVPQLALQGSVGVNVARRAVKGSQDLPTGTVSAASDQIEFGTTVQSDPWALFTNNIAALYYF